MNVSTLVRSRGLKALGAIAMTLALVLPVATATAAYEPRDRDSNAIMYGGAYSVSEWTQKYNGGDGRNSAASLKSIYGGFGITPENMKNTVAGTVTKSGNVVVNGKVVASNVWTSGRQPIGNSTAMNGVYLRPPAVSFLSESLPAFVNMEGGAFKYAVVKSCGNPVYSQAKPFGQIYKRVILADGSSVAADDRAHAAAQKTGATFKYQVTVTNNGHAAMTNVVVKDSLPAGIELVSNPSNRNITHSMGTIAASTAKSLTMTVRVTDKQNGKYIENIACFTADQNQKGCNNAWIKVNAPVTSQPATEQPKEEGKGNQPKTDDQPKTDESPKGDDNKKPVVAVPVVTQPDTDDSDKNEQPAQQQVPVTLPEAGAGALAGLAGLGAMGYSVRSYVLSRRSLKNSLRK